MNNMKSEHESALSELEENIKEENELQAKYEAESASLQK